MSKLIEEMSFEELAEYHTQKIHSGLLENGGRGLKNAVFTALDSAITWNKSIEKKETEKPYTPKRLMRI